MSSLTATPTSSALAATSSSATKVLSAGSHLKVRGRTRTHWSRRILTTIQVVGIILAVASGTLIGSSFVFKKKGLLRSQAGGEVGQGVAYLKSVSPNSLRIRSENCNERSAAVMVVRDD